MKNEFKTERKDLILRVLSFINVNEKSGSINDISIRVKTFKEISTYLFEEVMSETYLHIDKNNKKIAKCTVYTGSFISLPPTIDAKEEIKMGLPFIKNKIKELGEVIIELTYIWKGKELKKFYSLTYDNQFGNFIIKEKKYKEGYNFFYRN